MSPITFKFFGPSGDCRRVTYDDTPGLAAINELVDGMIEGRRVLTYRDSDGDVVLLKTSQDVAEAVRDAQASGLKSIRVQIRSVRSSNSSSSSSSNSKSNCGPRANCYRRASGPYRGRCWSRGLFGHPHRISVDLEGVADEVDEIFRHFAPFLGIHVPGRAEATNETAATSHSDGHAPKDENDHAHVSQEASKQVEEPAKETNKQVEEPAKVESAAPTRGDEAVATPTIEETIEPQEAGAGFTFVENEPEDNHAQAAAAPEPEPKKDGEAEDGVDEKLKLLKDMGFELPKDVARKMIKELNGRMDLIVRALVANQK